ncbi:DNA alkylation repair protein [Mycoplasmatota bacterium]|nr:DNA alkylation repair protein [Mycoplasmatota bacterium]
MINYLNELMKDINQLEDKSAVSIEKLANKYYKFLPKFNEAFLAICNQLIISEKLYLFSIATLWLKKRKSILDIKHLSLYENWIEKYVDNWGKCDQLCYRLINPLIEKYDELYTYIVKWSNSSKPTTRRVSLVSFIHSSKGHSVLYDFNKILPIIDKLKDDSDIHVQKAVGWVLKCSYYNYPSEVVIYLRKNVKILNRLIFRYSLENMPIDLKQELMSLDYK